MSYMTFSQSDVCSKKRFTGGREKNLRTVGAERKDS